MDLALAVNDVLTRYIQIHDDMMAGSSLRKLLPIPGFFKAIDFCSHKDELADLQGTLLSIRAAVEIRLPTYIASSVEGSFLSELLHYDELLHDALDKLRSVAVELCKKAHGSRTYKWRIFMQDMSEYKERVKAYRAQGAALNIATRRLQA